MRIAPRAIGPAHGVRSAHRPSRTAVPGHRRRVAMTALSDTVEADQALKAKHRAMWALGDYPSVAAEIIPDLGAVLVEACGVEPGARVLDVAAGSGNATIPAALTGSSVVACDLKPELFTSGRENAVRHGVA